MYKHIPNILSVSRIFISLALFFIPTMSTTFQVLYIIAFITDALDGYIARKTNTTSELGHNLDSIADLVYSILVITVIIPWMHPSTWIVIAIAVCALIKITPLIMVKVVTGRFESYHNWISKSAILCMVIMPFLYLAIGEAAIVITLIPFYIGAIIDCYLGDKKCKDFYKEKAAQQS